VVGGPRSGGWALLATGSSVPGEYNSTNMEVQLKEGPKYPVKEGAKISGDHPGDLVTQGVAAGMATCDPAQGVQAQGTLGSEATCATTSSESLPMQSEPSRQMAAMPQPTSRRQRKKLALVAAEPPGAVETDDRTAVSQASSSETDEPDESQMDSVEEDEHELSSELSSGDSNKAWLDPGLLSCDRSAW